MTQMGNSHLRIEQDGKWKNLEDFVSPINRSRKVFFLTLKNVEPVTSGNFGPCINRLSIERAMKLLKSTRKTI